MNDRRKTEIELAQKGYIAAYMSAHPATWHKALPHISYENGWWCFRDRDNKLGRPFARYRSIHFELMTKRLLAMRDSQKAVEGGKK